MGDCLLCTRMHAFTFQALVALALWLSCRTSHYHKARQQSYSWAPPLHQGSICTLQDDFEDWPPRLIIRTDDPAVGISDVLPAAVLAALARSTKLRASALEVLEFEGMGDLRMIARKLRLELGDSAFLAACMESETGLLLTCVSGQADRSHVHCAILLIACPQSGLQRRPLQVLRAARACVTMQGYNFCCKITLRRLMAGCCTMRRPVQCIWLQIQWTQTSCKHTPEHCCSKGCVSYHRRQTLQLSNAAVCA